MPIGLGPKRDDRRRRALVDDRHDEAAGEPTDVETAVNTPEPALKRKRRRYMAAARRRSQPSIVDLIPRRWWALLLVWALLAVVAFGVGGWLWSVQGVSQPIVDQVPSPDSIPVVAEFASRAQLWCLSLTLTLAAFVCGQIYLIRRHRSDDYRGHYRIWIWGATGVLLVSFDASVGAHRFLIASTVDWVMGQNLELNVRVFDWGVLLLGLLFSARLFWEMRDSNAKWGVVATGVACILAGLGPVVPGLSEFEAAVWPQILLLAASSCFLASLITYSRYTILDAHGLVRSRKTQRASRANFSPPTLRLKAASDRSDSPTQSECPTDSPSTGQPDHAVASEPAEMSATTEVLSTQSSPNSLGQSGGLLGESTSSIREREPKIHSLSKAKRKKLSKKQRRQQRRAA